MADRSFKYEILVDADASALSDFRKEVEKLSAATDEAADAARRLEKESKAAKTPEATVKKLKEAEASLAKAEATKKESDGAKLLAKQMKRAAAEEQAALIEKKKNFIFTTRKIGQALTERKALERVFAAYQKQREGVLALSAAKKLSAKEGIQFTRRELEQIGILDKAYLAIAEARDRLADAQAAGQPEVVKLNVEASALERRNKLLEREAEIRESFTARDARGRFASKKLDGTADLNNFQLTAKKKAEIELEARLGVLEGIEKAEAKIAQLKEKVGNRAILVAEQEAKLLQKRLKREEESAKREAERKLGLDSEGRNAAERLLEQEEAQRKQLSQEELDLRQKIEGINASAAEIRAQSDSKSLTKAEFLLDIEKEIANLKEASSRRDLSRTDQEIIDRKKELDDLKRSDPSKTVVGRAQRFLFTFRRLVGVLAIFTLARKAVQGFTELLKVTIKFNETLETSRIAIASIVSAAGEVRGPLGELVDDATALERGLELAGEQQEKLRKDALLTAATYEELVEAYQTAIAPGLQVGFDLDEIRKFSVQISQAATAIGVPQTQLAEEIRSILQGTIRTRDTRIAVSLGITNADIRRAKELGNLSEFLNEKFQAFSRAAKISQNTFSFLFSNAKDALTQLLAFSGARLFEEVKESIQSVLDVVVEVDEITGEKDIAEPLIKRFEELFDIVIAGKDVVEQLGASLFGIFDSRVLTVFRDVSEAVSEFVSGGIEVFGIALKQVAVIIASTVKAFITLIEVIPIPAEALGKVIASFLSLAVVTRSVLRFGVAIKGLASALKLLTAASIINGLKSLFGLTAGTAVTTTITALNKLAKTVFLLAAGFSLWKGAWEAVKTLFDAKEIKALVDNPVFQSLSVEGKGVDKLISLLEAGASQEEIDEALEQIRGRLSRTGIDELEPVSSFLPAKSDRITARIQAQIGSEEDWREVALDNLKALRQTLAKEMAEAIGIDPTGRGDDESIFRATEEGSITLKRSIAPVEDIFRKIAGASEEAEAAVQDMGEAVIDFGAGANSVLTATIEGATKLSSVSTDLTEALKTESNRYRALKQFYTADADIRDAINKSFENRTKTAESLKGVSLELQQITTNVLQLERERESITSQIAGIKDVDSKTIKRAKDDFQKLTDLEVERLSIIEKQNALKFQGLEEQDEGALEKQRQAAKKLDSEYSNITSKIKSATEDIEAKWANALIAAGANRGELVRALKLLEREAELNSQIEGEKRREIELTGDLEDAFRKSRIVTAKQLQQLFEEQRVERERSLAVQALELDLARKQLGITSTFGNVNENEAKTLELENQLSKLEQQKKVIEETSLANQAALRSLSATVTLLGAEGEDTFMTRLKQDSEAAELATEDLNLQMSTLRNELEYLNQQEESPFKTAFLTVIDEFSTNGLTKFQATLDIMRTAFKGFADIAGQSFADIFDPTNTQSAKERFGRFLLQLVAQAVSAIVQIYIIQETLVPWLKGLGKGPALKGGPAGVQDAIRGTGNYTGGLIPDSAVPGIGHFTNPQGYYTGGKIKTFSKQPNALDTVPIWAQPGEFMMRLSAVKKYGVGVMQAINNGLIDSTSLRGLTGVTGVAGHYSTTPKRGYASGGMIQQGIDRANKAATAASGSTSAVGSAPSMGYLIAGEDQMETMLRGGRSAMLRFMSENSSQIRSIMG